MRLLTSTPRQDGFWMPGEFEPHRGTYMLWPERTDTWRNGAEPAQRAYAQIAAAISGFEPITMGVSAGQYDKASRMLPEAVRVVELSSDDAWMRDCGPTFVKNEAGVLRGVSWQFNAWGGLVDGLYSPWDQDSRVAVKVCELESAACYRLDDFVLEGGSIHVDGQGTAVVTEACLLSAGRNPDMTREQIEERLRNYLNIDKVIWLARGICPDETNEHVDNVFAFVQPGQAVLAWTDDQNSPQFELSAGCLEALQSQTDAHGRKIAVHKLPLPTPLLRTREDTEGIRRRKGTYPRRIGESLAASYVNYYVCNGAVILPGFGVPEDEEALNIVSALYPDRQVVQIPTREILLGGGNIHCITQQIPK
jgi:agmatine deiminase